MAEMETAKKSKGKILWLHGWGMSPAVWEPLWNRLPGYEHHALSYRGCRAPEDFREALRAKLASDNGPWILAGWSMGAMLALDAVLPPVCSEGESSVGASGGAPHALSKQASGKASAAAADIRAWIVISGTLRFCSADRASGWPRRIVERMRSKLSMDREAVLRDFAAGMFSEGERKDEHHAEWLDQIKISDDPDEGLAAGLSLLLELDLRERWNGRGELPPLLWIHGGEDRVCPPGAAPLPGRHVLRLNLEGAGHAPFITRKEQMVKEIRGFLHDFDA